MGPLTQHRLLALFEQQRENLSKGRPKGARANQSRAEEHRAIWATEARRILREKPRLFGNIRVVAAKIVDFCHTRRITLRNGRPYKVSTVYCHLIQNKRAALRIDLNLTVDDAKNIQNSGQSPESVLCIRHMPPTHCGVIRA